MQLVLNTDATRLRLTVAPLDPLAIYDYDLVSNGELLRSVKLIATTTTGEDLGASPLGAPADPALADPSELLRRVVASRTAADKVRAARTELDDIVVEFNELPETGQPRVLELWLSNVAPQRLRSLEIEHGAQYRHVLGGGGPTYSAGIPLEGGRDPVWLTHGSSITHSMGFDSYRWLPGLVHGSGSAHSPARTWPGTAARAAQCELVSLGFGGQCVLDQTVARAIRDVPVLDCISLKLGINVHNKGCMGIRSFGQAALGFILTIRCVGTFLLHSEEPFT